MGREHPLADQLKLVLASASPRRRNLLALAGLPFDVQPVDIDETPLPGERPSHYVLRLAEEKARALAVEQEEASLVIAADTTVVHEGRILGKPADSGEAREMLVALRGHAHTVFTGIALLQTDGSLLIDLAQTEVPMRAYSDEEMEAYIASGDPLDKAGAYAIQHAGFHPVEGLAGCFANVAGLPLCHLTRSLTKWGIQLEADIPSACQAYLGYDCPVYEEVLNWTQ